MIHTDNQIVTWHSWQSMGLMIWRQTPLGAIFDESYFVMRNFRSVRWSDRNASDFLIVKNPNSRLSGSLIFLFFSVWGGVCLGFLVKMIVIGRHSCREILLFIRCKDIQMALDCRISRVMRNAFNLTIWSTWLTALEQKPSRLIKLTASGIHTTSCSASRRSHPV